VVSEEYLPQLARIVPRQILFCTANMVLYVVTLWVHNVFVKQLEEKGMKLCIHHREFEPGIPITENIDKYMSKSWKVVAIMSGR
jgi:hypothetical protein